MPAFNAVFLPQTIFIAEVKAERTVAYSLSVIVDIGNFLFQPDIVIIFIFTAFNIEAVSCIMPAYTVDIAHIMFCRIFQSGIRIPIVH